MSGHSKWSTIKRQKGAADIKRGLTFTKLANAITIATKLGGSGDVDANSRLRVALEAARAANMPKDNTQRAIDRGLGKLPGQSLEEMVFEGFGPGKVAFLAEVVTDNRMKALQEIKNLFERGGGSLVGQGAVAYMFDKKGEIRVKGKGGSPEGEMLELIDLGAEDVEDYLDNNMQRYLVYVESAQLANMNSKLTQNGFEIESQELVFKPNTVVEIREPEAAKKVMNFTQELEEREDVQKVHANFSIPEEFLNT